MEVMSTIICTPTREWLLKVFEFHERQQVEEVQIQGPDWWGREMDIWGAVRSVTTTVTASDH